MKFNIDFSREGTFYKNVSRPLVTGLTILGMSTAAFSAVGASTFVEKAHLPTNAYERCPVSEDTMKMWFGGTITQNGWVEPADSTAKIFKPGEDNTRCDFYKWGAQMFLWLTNETGTKDKHLFTTSPTFYDISVADATIGKRDFVADNGTLDLGLGKKDNIEIGQASDSDILIAQDGSLVYFGLHANNVFALYTTGLNNDWFAKSSSLSSEFPNTSGDLTALTSKVLASKLYSGYLPIQAKDALAMELKTAWVDATGWGANKIAQYITTEAVVPVFSTNIKKGPWPITGQKKITLAMVGMHVVGTVTGHPEMVWATFEHVNNAPANTYIYNTNNAPTPATDTKAYDSSTNNWTFLPKNAPLPTSIEATGVGIPCVVGQEPTEAQIKEYQAAFQNIVQCGAGAIGKKGSITNQIISPNTPITDIVKTDVARIDAWGGGTTANNTDLVSLNKSVLTWLKPGDYRGNYIQTGGIWTSDGSIPTNGKQTDNPHLVGSLKLANTTMETYDQIEGSGFNPINCFGCHNASSTSPAFSISHIVQSMNSLPEKPASK